MSTNSDTPFSPAGGAARWTKSMLVATLVLSVISIVFGLLQIDLLSTAASNGISGADAAANDSRQQIIRVLRLPIGLGTGVAFLIWFHRVHRNLASLGCLKIEYASGWVVGGFFVPFLNLVRPYQVMREVWHGSDPSGLDRDVNTGGPFNEKQRDTTALVGWWWALYLSMGILGFFAVQLNLFSYESLSPQEAIENLKFISGFIILNDVIEVMGAIVTIRLVGHLTVWQSDRAHIRYRSVGELLD